jgi:hypothetical protein
MTTQLNTIFNLIKQWEGTWFDDMKRTEADLVAERRELETQMRSLGVNAECAPWVQALDVAIAEQGKYEAWLKACSLTHFAYDGSKRRRATEEEKSAKLAALHAERSAMWEQHEAKGLPAPDWMVPYFNPRTGPAARIHVNGQYPPSNP